MIEPLGIPGLIELGGPALKWLTSKGISSDVLIEPDPVLLAYGFRAPDGRFEVDYGGATWLAFREPDDIVFWQPRSGQLATWEGRSFALNENIIDVAATYSFDFKLNLFSTPLEWLQAGRDGIVISDWSRAFDRLREVPRIAVQESVLGIYRKSMHPRRLPSVFVIPERMQREAS